MKTCYTIFKKQVAEQLIREGYELVEIKPNYKHSTLVVYHFKYTDALINRVSNITNTN